MLKPGFILFAGFLAAGLTSCSGGDQSNASAIGASVPVDANGASHVINHDLSLEGISGVYRGVLPCGDCKEIVTILEIADTGDYKISERFEGRAEFAELDSAGKVLLDGDLRRVTLDPSGEGWENRVFEVTHSGGLRPLDSTGVAYSSDGVADLNRTR